MLNWFYNLNLGEALWLGIGIAAINFLFSLWMSIYIPKYYRLSGSLELVLNRMRVLDQYIYRVIFIVTFILISSLCLFQFYWPVGNLTFQIALSFLFSYLLFGLILSVNKMITYKMTSSIKGADTTRVRIIGQIFLGLPILYIPLIISFSCFLSLYQGDYDNFYSFGYLIIFELSLFMVLFIFVIPLTIGRSLKAIPMEDSLIKDRLYAFIDRTGICQIKFYVWPVKKGKNVNMLVTGYRRMRIYIADTLIERFTEKQIESILAHEIGHIKYFHLWIRRGLLVLFLILVYGLVVVLSPLVDSATISSVMAFLMILLFIILYLGFGMRVISRFQERQADRYVLDLGVDYRDYSTALLELARLNHMLTKLNKVDEAFQTHPSIVRRINWILQKANGSYKEIMEYKNRDNLENNEVERTKQK